MTPLPSTKSSPGPDEINALVLGHRRDPRRRLGQYLEVHVVDAGVSRMVTVRLLGCLVMAAKADDGEPVSLELLRALDEVARDWFRGGGAR